MTDVAVHPVIAWPREAAQGRTYLMTVDLQLAEPGWDYEREEYAVHCLVSVGPACTVAPLGTPAVILHRFGGTYGPARFLLTAQEQAENPELSVTLVNHRGLPIRRLGLPMRVVADGAAEAEVVDLPTRPPTDMPPPSSIVTEIEEWLSRGEAKIALVVGDAGSGKTTVLRQLADRSNGVVVPAAERTLDELADLVARMFGMPSSSPEEFAERFRAQGPDVTLLFDDLDAAREPDSIARWLGTLAWLNRQAAIVVACRRGSDAIRRLGDVQMFELDASLNVDEREIEDGIVESLSQRTERSREWIADAARTAATLCRGDRYIAGYATSFLGRDASTADATLAARVAVATAWRSLESDLRRAGDNNQADEAARGAREALSVEDLVATGKVHDHPELWQPLVSEVTEADRADAVMKLAPHLTEGDVDIALQAIVTIADPAVRFAALEALAQRMTPEQLAQAGVLHEPEAVPGLDHRSLAMVEAAGGTVGREWVFEEFEAFERQGGGYFAIVGPPGVGKTHLAASMAASWSAPAYFFGPESTPVACLRHLCVQLLRTSDSSPELPDDERALQFEFTDLLERAAKRGERLRLVIDGLDEDTRRGDWLPNVLPPGISIVVTSRTAVRAADATLALSPFDTRHLADLETYARARLPEEAAAEAVRASEGNFAHLVEMVGRQISDEVPPDLRYHPEHSWVRLDGDTGTFGVTWYAQDQMGEMVFVEPPEVGATVTQGEPYAEIESVKAVSDVVAPLSGVVVEVNKRLADAPEVMNAQPYGDGWIAKVRVSNPSELDALLDAETYRKSLS